MDGIFISYRRDDSAGYAGRIYDRLVPHFGANRVFMDVEGIELGADFVTAIEEAVGSCQVLIVVIGDEWLSTTDRAGRRRLDDPHDFIRLETVAALKRGIRVVPVLVGGALMPRAEDLPKDLKPLARRQAIEISHKQWDATTAELIQALDAMLSHAAARASTPLPLMDLSVDDARPAEDLALAQGAQETRETKQTSGAKEAEPQGTATVWRSWRWGAGAIALLLVVAGGWAWLGGDGRRGDGDRAEGEALLTAQRSPDGRGAAGTSAPATVVAAATPPVASSGAPVPSPPVASRPAAVAARVPAAPETAPAAAVAAPLATPTPEPAPRPKPTIRVFEAQPDATGARLCYLVNNAESLTLSPKPGELKRLTRDCVSVSVLETTTYTLTARNAVDTVRKSISVSSRPVAVAPPAAVPVPAPATPAEPARPAPEAARPAAESNAAAGVPRVGESWTYRTSGKWPTSPKRSIVIAVQSVANGVVTDGLSAEGLAADARRSTGARPMFMSWPSIGNEFSPYLAAFIDMGRMETMKGFATPDIAPNWGQWYSEARLLGQETVQVPAGSFQAHKVEVWSSRHTTGGPTQAAIEPVRMHYLIWYAPGAKRYVKMQRRMLMASGLEAERDVFELVQAGRVR